MDVELSQTMAQLVSTWLGSPATRVVLLAIVGALRALGEARARSVEGREDGSMVCSYRGSAERRGRAGRRFSFFHLLIVLLH